MPPPPGMTPMLTSGWPKTAVGDARMMSHISASSQPPPSFVATRVSGRRVEWERDVRHSR